MVPIKSSLTLKIRTSLRLQSVPHVAHECGDYRCYCIKVTPIKATMSNLPVYYMALYKMHVGVMETSDSVRRNFLWDGNSDRRKLHLMKWSDMVKAKALGGLGLGDFSLKNHALLAKWWWWWRFGVETEALWRRIIISKFGEGEKGWVPSRVPRYGTFGCWGVISYLGDVASFSGEVFTKGAGFRVREGS
eukprot:TRINITY_DN12190_c0_g6_i1.p1 TRINITY_DN12190_c0_g6~~TRINITY_DN12190_c0_g6_i1.p1  ORF type:complete len:190 (-),score=19.63 TRINITY_DN12190_c0_g6_i1:1184-1753(-)